MVSVHIYSRRRKTRTEMAQINGIEKNKIDILVQFLHNKNYQQCCHMIQVSDFCVTENSFSHKIQINRNTVMVLKCFTFILFTSNGLVYTAF